MCSNVGINIFSLSLFGFHIRKIVVHDIAISNYIPSGAGVGYGFSGETFSRFVTTNNYYIRYTPVRMLCVTYKIILHNFYVCFIIYDTSCPRSKI